MRIVCDQTEIWLLIAHFGFLEHISSVSDTVDIFSKSLEGTGLLGSFNRKKIAGDLSKGLSFLSI